jgi:hypothetical protein
MLTAAKEASKQSINVSNLIFVAWVTFAPAGFDQSGCASDMISALRLLRCHLVLPLRLLRRHSVPGPLRVLVATSFDLCDHGLMKYVRRASGACLGDMSGGVEQYIRVLKTGCTAIRSSMHITRAKMDPSPWATGLVVNDKAVTSCAISGATYECYADD